MTINEWLDQEWTPEFLNTDGLDITIQATETGEETNGDSTTSST